MKVCTRCGGKFGLARYRTFTFNGHLAFCSRVCKNLYAKDVVNRIKKMKYLAFLGSR